MPKRNLDFEQYEKAVLDSALVKFYAEDRTEMIKLNIFIVKKCFVNKYIE